MNHDMSEGECCEKCRRVASLSWTNGVVYVCGNPSCKCHTQKTVGRETSNMEMKINLGGILRGEGKLPREFSGYESNPAEVKSALTFDDSTTEEGWEREFDEYYKSECGSWRIDRALAKDFIRKLLAAQAADSYKRGREKGDAEGNFRGYMEGLESGKTARDAAWKKEIGRAQRNYIQSTGAQAALMDVLSASTHKE